MLTPNLSSYVRACHLRERRPNTAYTRVYRCLRLELWRHARARPPDCYASSQHQLGRQTKQQQWRFCFEIMEAIESEVKMLIDSGFIREEQHPDWIANIVPVPRKNRKIRICIDNEDLNATTLKINFLSRSRMSWMTICVILRGCFSWMASQGIIK